MMIVGGERRHAGDARDSTLTMRLAVSSLNAAGEARS